MELRCECCDKNVSRQDIWIAFGYNPLCQNCYETINGQFKLQNRIIKEMEEDLEAELSFRRALIASLNKGDENRYEVLFYKREEFKREYIGGKR